MKQILYTPIKKNQNSAISIGSISAVIFIYVIHLVWSSLIIVFWFLIMTNASAIELFYYGYMGVIFMCTPLTFLIGLWKKPGMFLIILLGIGYMVFSIAINCIFFSSVMGNVFSIISIAIITGLVLSVVYLASKWSSYRSEKLNVKNCIIIMFIAQIICFTVILSSFAFFIPIIVTPVSKRVNLVFWGYSTNSAVMEKCRTYNITLTMDISKNDLVPGSQKANDLKTLLNNGVKTIICLTPENGFADITNGQELIDLYDNFTIWLSNEGLSSANISRIAIDSECSLSLFDLIMEKYSKLDFAGLIQTIIEVSPSQSTIDESVQSRELLCSKMKLDGFKPVIVVLPSVINDLMDGDSDIQHAFYEHSFPNYGWDEVVFMSYRMNAIPAYKEYVKLEWLIASGLIFPDYMVYYYSRLAKSFPYAKSYIFLGVLGEPPYTNIAEISKDIRIVRSFGYDEVWLFYLPYFLDTFGTSGLDSLYSCLTDLTPVTLSFVHPGYRLFTTLLTFYYWFDFIYPYITIRVW